MQPVRATASAETTASSTSSVAALLPLSPSASNPRDQDRLCNSMHINCTVWAEKCIYNLSTKHQVETLQPELQLAVVKSSWKSLTVCMWGTGKVQV